MKYPSSKIKVLISLSLDISSSSGIALSGTNLVSIKI